MNFGFVIDNRKCIGCHACTVACKAEHDVPIGVNRTWVKYIEKGKFPNTSRHFSVLRCNHCADAPCVEICPVSALFTRSDGIVDFDNRRCIGCKACMQACPYDALYLDPETHTAAKCNYCAHRVDIGLEPACVNVCPEHAIISGDLDDEGSEISQLLAEQPVTVRKEEKGTEPKLFYIDGDRVSLNPTLTDQSDQYFGSSQSRGVGHFARFARERLEKADPEEMKKRLDGAGQDWIGDSESSVLLPKDVDQRKGREVLSENARRVYDTPAQGVLWGWQVSAYVWTKEVAAGAFLAPLVGSLVLKEPIPSRLELPAVIVSLLFLALTGVLLVLDLDQPKRFAYVILRPQWRSWLVRGAYVVTLYGLFLGLWPFALSPLEGFLKTAVTLIGIGLAVLTAAYTAFLFSQAKGRDFWQSPMLGPHMIAHAVMAGAAVWSIAAFWLDMPEAWVRFLGALLAGGIVLHLAMLGVEFATTHSTRDAAAVASMILRGRFKQLFWWGAILIGSLAPLVLWWSSDPALLALGGVQVLAGLYFLDHIWVKAPQLIPLS